MRNDRSLPPKKGVNGLPSAAAQSEMESLMREGWKKVIIGRITCVQRRKVHFPTGIPMLVEKSRSTLLMFFAWLVRRRRIHLRRLSRGRPAMKTGSPSFLLPEISSTINLRVQRKVEI
jgi:hypothetical protein